MNPEIYINKTSSKLINNAVLKLVLTLNIKICTYIQKNLKFLKQHIYNLKAVLIPMITLHYTVKQPYDTLCLDQILFKQFFKRH